MMNLDFSFDRPDWELALERLHKGDTITAIRLLALLEGEDDYAVEDALQALEEKGIALDIRELPAAESAGDTAVRLRREQELVKQGRLLQGLDENDPLRLYLEEVSRIPVAANVETLAANCAAGDEKAQTQLTNSFLGCVVELAKEHTGRGVLLLDLIQEGSLGLWQAVLNWQGGQFESHAYWWIRQYMARLVTQQARAGGVGQKLKKSMEAFRAADQRLLSQLGRNPTLEEIAVEMGVSAEEAAFVEDQLQSARTVEKANAPKNTHEEDEDKAVEDTAYFQSRQRIMEMLSGLEELDAQVLSLRFGLEGGLPMSPEDTGRKLGMTAEEVVNREAAALQKLRNER